MRKAVILCVVFSCAAVLTACAGNGGNTDTTGDAGAMPENVLPLEIGETEALETMLPFDPKLPIQYSPDGKSALITEDNHTDQVKRLYQVNEPKGCMEETRWWKLQKETGQLEIWDALENQSIFEGPVSLDETGKLSCRRRDLRMLFPCISIMTGIIICVWNCTWMNLQNSFAGLCIVITLTVTEKNVWTGMDLRLIKTGGILR